MGVCVSGAEHRPGATGVGSSTGMSSKGAELGLYEYPGAGAAPATGWVASTWSLGGVSVPAAVGNSLV